MRRGDVLRGPGGEYGGGIAGGDCVARAADGQHSAGGLLAAVARAHPLSGGFGILIHQPLISGELIAPATDLEIEAKEMLRLRERLYAILSKHTGQSAEKIEKDCDRNLWLDADEAIKYGLADRIIQKAPEAVKASDKES